MSIDQLARQLAGKRKQQTDTQSKISAYARTAADETAKAGKAAQAAARTKQDSARQRKLCEEQRHRKLASDAMARRATYEKRLSSLDGDVSKLEKKLNEERIAESKRMVRNARDMEKRMNDIKPVEINVSAPLVNGDNYGNVAVGNHVQQQMSISTSEVLPERYRELEELLGRLSDELVGWNLDAAEVRPLSSEIDSVRGQIHAPEPDDSLIARGLTAIKGLLAPIGMGISAGVSAGVSEQVKDLIGAMQALPF